jgi:hypothetical protein
MTPAERELLERLDHMIMNAADGELEKIQEIDIKTQMSGLSFCDVFVNSKYLVNQHIKQETRESK